MTETHDRIVYNRDRLQPFTVWCGPHVLFFTSDYMEARRIVATHICSRKRGKQ